MVSARGRFLAAGLFLLIAAGGAVLWAADHGRINLKYWLGICGFKQRFGLPCPGCGWTHAAQAFFTGHFIQAFILQPAAAFFCVVAALAAIFALLYAVFGINFGFLKRWFATSARVSMILVAVVIIILAGWAVTLIRTILENSGH